MKTLIGVLFTGMILFFGCSQTDSENTGSTPDQNIVQEALPSNQVIPVSTPDSGTATNIENAAVPVPSTPIQTAPAQTAAGMNPPHGEPGHRCDIPVGSPLNSPPSNTPAGNTSVPVNVSPGVPSTPVTTAPGMNPPHGQPGHDCTIAVGAPLKK